MKTLLSAAIFFLILGFSNKLLGFIYINTSSSLPYGIYLSIPVDNPQRGDLILICLDNHHASLAKKRHYIAHGSCPQKSAPLGKYVQALEGDTISIKKAEVYVNNRYIKNSKILKQDLLGNALTGELKAATLTQNEFLVMNNKENSFDSRYFGVIKKGQILSKLYPIFIFN